MTTICAFSVALHNRARAAPIRYPGFVNIGPNLSGCTNRRPDLTHSVGPRLDWRAPGLLGLLIYMHPPALWLCVARTSTELIAGCAGYL
jgi:hypothetical protein